MNAELANQRIKDVGIVYDIGQLEPGAIKSLQRQARAGELVKIKTCWPWPELGVRKTAYCLRALPNHYER